MSSPLPSVARKASDEAFDLWQSHMSAMVALMTSEPLDKRLHLAVSASMRRDLELASGAPGFKSEADVVRYALDQVLPGLIAQARERYAGRTRVLVDTAPAPDPEAYRRPPTHSPRPQIQRADVEGPNFAPLSTEDLRPHLDALDQHVRELAEQVEIEYGIVVPETRPAASPDIVAPTA